MRTDRELKLLRIFRSLPDRHQIAIMSVAEDMVTVPRVSHDTRQDPRQAVRLAVIGGIMVAQHRPHGVPGSRDDEGAPCGVAL